MTQDNPYSTMLNVLRGDAAERSVAPWCLGRVTSVSPLAVEKGGVPLSGSDLLVNPAMLAHTRQLQLTGLSGEIVMEEGGGAVSVGQLSGSGSFGGALAAGDQVVLLQSGDGQQYVLLCKAVSA